MTLIARSLLLVLFAASPLLAQTPTPTPYPDAVRGLKWKAADGGDVLTIYGPAASATPIECTLDAAESGTDKPLQACLADAITVGTTTVTGGTSNCVLKESGGALACSSMVDDGSKVVGSLPLFIGGSTTLNSTDSQIVVSRDVDDSVSGSGHGFSDSADVTRGGGIAYNAYDARTTFSGTENYDHFVGFQSIPTYSSSGTIGEIYGLFASPVISASAGTVADLYGSYSGGSVGSGATVTDWFSHYANNPTGAGTVSNLYGLYVGDLSKGSNLNRGVFLNMSAGPTKIPLEILHTGAQADVTQVLLNKSTGGVGDQHGIKWKSSTLEGAAINMELRSSSIADLVFKTNATGTTNLAEAMRLTGAGQMQVAATGSGAAPTVSSKGDPDTGIRFPGSNFINVAAAGSDSYQFSAAAFYPFSNGTRNLGAASLRWLRAYTTRLTMDLSTPSSLGDGDWWVECSGTSPSRTCSTRVRDGGVTQVLSTTPEF